MSTSTGETMSNSQSAPPHEQETEWSVEALGAVWARQRGQVNERIGVLESALTALEDDRIEADLRCEAERAAHTLAGSLGMFAFMGASDAARKLEQALGSPDPQCAPELSELLMRLQKAGEAACPDATMGP